MGLARHTLLPPCGRGLGKYVCVSMCVRGVRMCELLQDINQGFSFSTLLTYLCWIILCCGAVLCFVGYSTASLAPTHDCQ